MWPDCRSPVNTFLDLSLSVVETDFERISGRHVLSGRGIGSVRRAFSDGRPFFHRFFDDSETTIFVRPNHHLLTTEFDADRRRKETQKTVFASLGRPTKRFENTRSTSPGNRLASLAPAVRWPIITFPDFPLFLGPITTHTRPVICSLHGPPTTE